MSKLKKIAALNQWQSTIFTQAHGFPVFWLLRISWSSDSYLIFLKFETTLHWIFLKLINIPSLALLHGPQSIRKRPWCRLWCYMYKAITCYLWGRFQKFTLFTQQNYFFYLLPLMLLGVKLLLVQNSKYLMRPLEDLPSIVNCMQGGSIVTLILHRFFFMHISQLSFILL